jgi:putative DNA methylase
MGTPRYGLDEWAKLFSPRQLVALTTLSDLLPEVSQQVREHARQAGLLDDGVRLRDGGNGATAYADAVLTYLAFAIDKCADHWSSVCAWHNSHSPQIRNVFARQAVAMTWDWAEANPFSGKLASWDSMMRGLVGAIAELGDSCIQMAESHAVQRDARARVSELANAVVSTDPPYYDSVPYADISDFFYVWLRRNLADVWPDETATILTPKSEELVADNQRFGNRAGAKQHFESGMAEFMAELAITSHPDVPMTIYYAYKASESGGKTGWSTFLQAVLDAGLQVNATWPVRTELANRMRSIGANALASSIVLVCRTRDIAAPLASRGEFMAALRSEMPEAVQVLQSGNIAPVDMSQSVIGPGIRVFSRYAKVVESDGSAMSVSAALGIINDVLGEVLDGEEAELDPDTRFAVIWYSQHGYSPGRAGDADSQARAKNTSLEGLETAGIGEARAGFFRLLDRNELDADWSPAADSRLTVWEATQHLVAALDRSESEASQLLRQLGGYADRARQLAYVLFHRATENGWAEEAGAYNGLITAWPVLQAGATSTDNEQGQGSLL